MKAPGILHSVKDINRENIRNVIDMWFRKYPFQVAQFKTDLEYAKSEMANDNGMSREGLLRLHALIPKKLGAVMNVVCGPNWQEDPDYYPHFWSLCSDMKIKVNSMAKHTDRPQAKDDPNCHFSGQMHLDMANKFLKEKDEHR